MVVVEKTKEISLNKFQLKNILVGDKIIIIGMTGSGKTQILKAVMKRFSNIPAAIIISDTEEGNDNFKGTVPESYIFESWSPDLEKKIMDRQKKAMSKLSTEEKKASALGEVTAASLLLVMDDCGWNSKEWGKSQTMKKFFMNGRNWGLILIITLQDPMDLQARMRGQVNWCFLLKEKNFTKRKQMHEHYAGVVKNFYVFDELIRGCTEDYMCMVIDNKSTNYELKDSVFWYKAPIYPPFRLGSDKYWQQDARKYNPKYQEVSEEEMFDTKKPRIRIKKMYQED